MNPEDQRTSCPGFLDEYGIWNNGFECPSLSNHIRVCCGSDSRRYCCTLQQFHTNSSNSTKKSFLSNIETNLSLIKKLNFTFLTLPIQLTCIFILILFFLLVIIILIICLRSHKRKNQLIEEENVSTKQTLLNIEHFPFSPPHHQLFFNENNQQIKDALTTSTTSSRLLSDGYFYDWNKIEQSINRYPTVPIQSNEMTNYLLQGKFQQNDIIV